MKPIQVIHSQPERKPSQAALWFVLDLYQEVRSI